jgi:uncharacterized protein
MKEAILHLSKNFSIPVTEYAIQGNAVLGIREAGKTYTAMKVAEELLENNIPIIVYDPSGVWKNLKIGIEKHKGYPVVVAGGPLSDIVLTPKNAVDIVRAAMKENISLVIDLSTPELANKSTWIKIVQETVDLLMYENLNYGLRHVFLEEAAEFIPQRVQPQQAKVYASCERLARIGRNFRLGYTIINQRAEEVNKAILEICAFSLLHKQVGKNSLNSIKKWLELRQLQDTDSIIKSLPSLNKGECWALGESDKPQRVKVTARKTYHPNPRLDAGVQVHKVTTDVTGFVDKLNKQLNKPVPVTATHVQGKSTPRPAGAPDNTAALKQEIADLKQQIKELNTTCSGILKQYNNALALLGKIKADAGAFIDKPVLNSQWSVGVQKNGQSVTKINITLPKKTATASQLADSSRLGKCSREVIRFLAQYPNREFSKAQVAIATGYSSGSGGFNNALSELNTAGFIIRNGNLKVNADSMADIIAAVGEIERREYNIETYKENLGKCEREIYEVLLEHPDTAYTKEQLAGMTATTYSPGSGGFNNSLSRLNTLELIRRDRSGIQLNPELLELM